MSPKFERYTNINEIEIFTLDENIATLSSDNSAIVMQIWPNFIMIIDKDKNKSNIYMNEYITEIQIKGELQIGE